MKKKTNWNEHIDRLSAIVKNIELGKVTILTGKNGSGKSMIRKLLPSHMAKVMGEHENFVASTSMDDRAGVNDSRMMVFSRDCEWLPTSVNTYQSAENVLKSKGCYIVVDEIELGMGEELQYGMALRLNKLIEENQDKLGVLIITHSRIIVEKVKHDNFVNIEGMNEQEWLNRVIVPYTIEELDKNSTGLMKALDKRLKG